PIRSATTPGPPARDVRAAGGAPPAHHGLRPTIVGGCTGCEYDGFSHRARRDPERQVVAAWRPRGPT
ncbi:hypothetical protein, partial [Ilumatobacter sp.]|uniref:hypothetical protein n=1 Tax=Ilumatobacter sp. TaxID=1967498 RepID=UPI003AF57121